MKPRHLPACALSLLIAFGTPAFGASALSSNTVNVVLGEWYIYLDRQEVDAGPVTFHIINNGKEPHEMVIVRTDLSHDALPTRHGMVSETEAGDLIGEVEEFPPEKIRTAIFTLEPGRYVLFCNITEEEENGEIESHYREGMHVSFTVR